MNLFANKALTGILIGVVVAFFVTFGGWPGLLWLLLFLNIIKRLALALTLDTVADLHILVIVLARVVNRSWKLVGGVLD